MRSATQAGFASGVKHAVRLFLIAVAGAIILIIILSSNLDIKKAMPWIAVIAGTAVLFSGYLKNSAAARKLRAFRTTSALALIIHCTIWIIIIECAPFFKPIWIVGMLAEYPALTSIRGFYSNRLE